MKFTSNTADLEASTNLSGQLALGSAEDDIQEFLAVWHRRNLAVNGISMSFSREEPAQDQTNQTQTHILPSGLHDGPRGSGGW